MQARLKSRPPLSHNGYRLDVLPTNRRHRHWFDCHAVRIDI